MHCTAGPCLSFFLFFLFLFFFFSLLWSLRRKGKKKNKEDFNLTLLFAKISAIFLLQSQIKVFLLYFLWRVNYTCCVILWNELIVAILRLIIWLNWIFNYVLCLYIYIYDCG